MTDTITGASSQSKRGWTALHSELDTDVGYVCGVRMWSKTLDSKTAKTLRRSDGQDARMWQMLWQRAALGPSP
jgi:hypothetical protein